MFLGCKDNLHSADDNCISKIVVPGSVETYAGYGAGVLGERLHVGYVFR